MIKQFMFLLLVFVMNTSSAQVDTAKSIDPIRVSFDLKGRSIIRYPPKVTDSYEKGIVVLQIVVGGNGNVLQAKPGYAGTTTSSHALLAKARQAAFQAKFSRTYNLAEQKGTMTIGIDLE